MCRCKHKRKAIFTPNVNSLDVTTNCIKTNTNPNRIMLTLTLKLILMLALTLILILTLNITIMLILFWNLIIRNCCNYLLTTTTEQHWKCRHTWRVSDSVGPGSGWPPPRRHVTMLVVCFRDLSHVGFEYPTSYWDPASETWGFGWGTYYKNARFWCIINDGYFYASA